MGEVWNELEGERRGVTAKELRQRDERKMGEGRGVRTIK